MSFRELLGCHVVEAARSLLGCYLVKGPCRARIVEVEAYRGSDDPGSHAHRGETPRSKIMFGPPGFAYVYFNYGMYWLLNVTAEPEGQPAAILIRAAQPLSGQELMFARRPKARSEHDLLSGPGKMTLAFGITGQHNGLDLLDPNSELKIERGEVVSHIIERKRVGLSEGKGEHLPWRFIDAEALYWVSRPGLSDVKRARDSMSFSLYP